MNSSFEVIDGVGYWFDIDGNVVASQAPGYPVEFAQGVTDYSGTATTYISVGTSDSVTNWPQLLQAVGGAVSAWQLNQINIARAQQGKPPINAAAYGPQIGVGLNQQTMNLLMWGGLGLGAILLFGGRRRG